MVPAPPSDAQTSSDKVDWVRAQMMLRGIKGCIWGERPRFDDRLCGAGAEQTWTVTWRHIPPAPFHSAPSSSVAGVGIGVGTGVGQRPFSSRDRQQGDGSGSRRHSSICIRRLQVSHSLGPCIGAGVFLFFGSRTVTTMVPLPTFPKPADSCGPPLAQRLRRRKKPEAPFPGVALGRGSD
ncbi:hypothetical protein VUR80DRAFT_4232 [Thermomyces stellatus]